MGELLKALCPHWCGWSYLPSRARRWCRCCGQEQVWEPPCACGVRDPELGTTCSGLPPHWRDLYATEVSAVEIERQAVEFAEELERWTD